MQRVKVFIFEGECAKRKDSDADTLQAAIVTAASQSILLHVTCADIKQIFDELEERLCSRFTPSTEPQYEINFIGSTDPQFSGQHYAKTQPERACIYVPQDSAPPELLLAQKHFKDLCARDGKANQYLGFDYPEIPWSTRLGKNCGKTKFFIDYTAETFEKNKAKHTQALGVKSLRKLYDLTQPAVQAIIHEHDRKKKLLLHICCGPDAAGVVRQVKEEFELTCFWYDPNIQPQQEHDKRLKAFEKVMELESIPYITGEYDVQNFYSQIKGLETTPEQGAKCSKCYDMRLDRAAKEARDGEFDYYATTLAISPHKVQRKLIAFGELNQKRYGVPYFHRNFMQDDGFKDSVNYTTEHDIYRQDYCGCFYSLPEGGKAAQWLGEQLGYAALDNPQGDPEAVTAPQDIYQEYEARVAQSNPSDLKG